MRGKGREKKGRRGKAREEKGKEGESREGCLGWGGKGWRCKRGEEWEWK